MITVVDYDPAWPERFEGMRTEYAAAMAASGVPVVAIEHVGSTSVPGLAAKPVIDIDIVVREADVAAAAGVLVSLGFTPQGDLGVPQRWAFRAPARLPRTNTYVIVDGCLSLRNHLAVRDVLRGDEALRDEYAIVKKQAGARLDDIDEYVLAKNGIVQKILTAAGLTDAERASIAGNLWPGLGRIDEQLADTISDRGAQLPIWASAVRAGPADGFVTYFTRVRPSLCGTTAVVTSSSNR